MSLLRSLAVLNKAARYYRDYKAVRGSLSTRSSKPIARRVGRIAYAKASARLANRLFR